MAASRTAFSPVSFSRGKKSTSITRALCGLSGGRYGGGVRVKTGEIDGGKLEVLAKLLVCIRTYHDFNNQLRIRVHKVFKQLFLYTSSSCGNNLNSTNT